MNFTTIILAGGQSSRMGSNKALISYRGKPLIQHAVDLARLFTVDMLISANNHDLDYLGLPIVRDLLKVKAPLAGIHAGLKSSRTDWNLVLTCDMPNITKELIGTLMAALNDNLRLVLPRHGGFIEPLCGFYHKEMISPIERNFEAGKISLLDLPGLVPHRFVSVDDQVPGEIKLLFRNVNEKKDLLS
jgi:molybdopterin-guanine dinucleotide biosynthesis protein A